MSNFDKPIGRTRDLVVQELNGEILIYDLTDHRAFCLNQTSALVWKACDGTRSVSDIGAQLGNEDLVWLALDQLKEERLLDAAPQASAKFAGMSRREVVRKIGLGSVMALPIIASLVAPPAAQAQQSCGTSCTTPAQCPNQTCNRCSGSPQNPGGVCTA